MERETEKTIINILKAIGLSILTLPLTGLLVCFWTVLISGWFVDLENNTWVFIYISIPLAFIITVAGGYDEISKEGKNN